MSAQSNGWTHYRLVFRLESPLHIGWRKTGNLMQTRRYVPGKILWGALTARLVQMAGQGHNADAYRQVGEALQHCFRFGYLWPAQAQKDAGQWHPPRAPHFPWQEATLEAWDYLYLNGTARTALEAREHVASEGMLHQIEYIAPYTREGAPVYLVGDLWVKGDLEACVSTEIEDPSLSEGVQRWKEALSALQLGGERGYGWGKVRLFSCDEVKAPKISWGEGWEWRETAHNGDVEILITTDAKEPVKIPTHALAADFSDGERTERAFSDLSGPVEPWVGWERTDRGYRVSTARIVYMPDAKVPPGFQGVLHPWGYLYASEESAEEAR